MACNGTLLGGGTRSLEFTAVDKEIVIDSSMGTVLGFAFDSERSKIVNGIYVTHIALGIDTIVTLKITGHGDVTDPKITLDDVILIRKKDGTDAHNITIKKQEPSTDIEKILSIVTASKSPHISLHDIFNNIKLPEKQKATVGNQQQSYNYILNEIKVMRHSKYLEEKEKEKIVEVLPLTQPTPKTLFPKPSPKPSPLKKITEHFKITDKISFDESSDKEDFNIYLLLFVLLILVIIYLYKNN
jgi:hypothetical protein